MSKDYTTEDLIKILADERRACISGQRLNLKASPSGISPFIDQFLKKDGIQKFTAYNDFRAAVHQYQRNHEVSGIVWETLTVHGKTLRYPKVDDQLIGLPKDLMLLRTAKDSVITFWQEVTEKMDLYLSLNGGKFHQPIAIDDVKRIVQRTEWASLCKLGNEPCVEMILQLGWGKPEQAAYRRGWPESGSEQVHAVNPGCRPIG
ncbi:hypothetical protein K9N68_11855 [Kovacikia minuta CCNUW1]|uniref:hypothetical protein n=1 Tax=Kovacikia minuta TaxID=2931930 RepID=UPI001CCBBA20|nr:hypothetical protein [Kovacikia minuta]UBF28502.1 hypothetical protein K9N68_11855 [Kovacikia minuta CCNUW1]